MRGWPKGLLLFFLGLVMASPTSTKIGGAAWLLFVLVGLWAALRLPRARPLTHPLVMSSRFWLGICLVCLALQGVATLYWRDPWGDRHVEIRLLLGAAASYALAQRLCVLPVQKIWITHALALACWAVLGVSYIYGRETPSNPIPWAAGVSLMVCVLLPQIFRSGVVRWQQMAWALSVLAGVAGVLLSQSRGSYGLVLWVVVFISLVAFRALVRRMRKSQKSVANLLVKESLSAATVGVSLVILLLSFPRIYLEPVARVQSAWNEIESFRPSEVDQAQSGVNTSVGIRLHMWRMAAKEIPQAWLFGHGREARIAWVHQLGDQQGLEFFKNLSHLHNDALTALFDHGLFGLTSYLGLGVGLAALVLSRAGRDTGLSWSLAGVLWMHLTSGLTNANFGHNYYGVMLTLSLAVAWLVARDEKNVISAGPVMLPGA